MKLCTYCLLICQLKAYVCVSCVSASKTIIRYLQGFHHFFQHPRQNLKSVERHKASNLTQTCIHKLVTCLETCYFTGKTYVCG